jgi:uncharacterized protein (DUF169 family)
MSKEMTRASMLSYLTAAVKWLKTEEEISPACEVAKRLSNEARELHALVEASK